MERKKKIMLDKMKGKQNKFMDMMRTKSLSKTD